MHQRGNAQNQPKAGRGITVKESVLHHYAVFVIFLEFLNPGMGRQKFSLTPIKSLVSLP